MNCKTPFVSAALALVITPSLAWAQPAPAPNPAAMNGGSGITMAQFVARQSARIMAADTDGDGRISRAEMAVVPGKGGADPARRFDAMDTDHDGYIDKDELRAALEKRFHRMDRNGDGVLTPDERMAGRMQRQRVPPPSMSPTPQP